MKRLEPVFALGLVAFGLAVAWHAFDQLKLGILISPGAGFIPFGVGMILALLGGAWFVAAWLQARKPPAGAAPSPAGGEGESTMLSRFLPGVMLIVAYGWLFERAGFFLATLLFMVGWQKIVEREGWLKTALVSGICAVAMWALFSFLLKGVLPGGAWFE